MVGFWQAIIVALIAACSGAITAFVNGLIEASKKRKEKKDSTQQILEKLDKLEKRFESLEVRIDGLEKAQKITMQDRIRWLATKYIEAGQISMADYQDLKTMHEIYHKNLHGNGFLDDIMEDISELPKVR